MTSLAETMLRGMAVGDAIVAPTAPQRAGARAEAIEADGWEPWLRALFGRYLAAAFSDYQREFWDWAWAIQRGERPIPFLGIWPRHGSKSGSAELAAVMLGARALRKYALYVCRTQSQADKHVQNIADLLAEPALTAHYPALADRAVTRFNQIKGWRHDRLMTAAGFTVDAIGLDSDVRGLKVGQYRPDLIILDDIDDQHDSDAAVEKNLATIGGAILPAGAGDVAIIAMQNLIHDRSVFSRMLDRSADILSRRIVSGPHPAIAGLALEQDEDGRWLIVGGTPTWDFLSLARCQDEIDTEGPSFFRRENQHEVGDALRGLYAHVRFRHCRPDEVPDLVRACVWVDPTVTEIVDAQHARARALAGDAANAIQGDGLAPDGTIFRQFSLEEYIGPNDALREAIRAARRLGSPTVGVETNQGGDLWETEYRAAAKALGVIPPAMRSFKTGAGTGNKLQRQNQMLMEYERADGKIVHVLGTHHLLEAALTRFPEPPLDLADTAWTGWADLRNRLDGAGAASGGPLVRALVPMRGGRR